MKVHVSPALLELAPGETGSFQVTITNDAAQTLAPTLTISGVDPEQLLLPESLPILQPGESSTEIVEVVVPETVDAGEQRLGIQVVDPDGLQRATSATVEIDVGDRPPVAIEMNPASVRGRRSAALMTVLHNRGDEPLDLRLTGRSAGADVRFLHDEVVLQPGQDAHIPTEIEAHHRSWFRELRHGVMIQVRGRGAPRSAPATFAQRPAIPPLLVKVVAAVTALALFVTSVAVVFNRIADDDIPMAKSLVPVGFDQVGRVPGIDADPAAYTGVASVTGVVEGPADPAGTTVVIERISYGDQGTTDGDGQTRLAALTPVSRPMGVVVDRIDTQTDERGEFLFVDGLRAPGFYRVTASRAGFEIESQVATLTSETRDVELAFSLEPASGGISGRVTDANGTPMGGVAVTITDGDLIYTATSATEGNVGSWSVSAIATPQTYQVAATHHGYATATAIVELDGGQVQEGVNLQLEGGLGTIRGRLTYRGAGVGGITIDLEGNPTQRQTTTLTEGNLAGSFEFPGLRHGTYTLTFSGDGWLTQTTQVVVDRGDVRIDVSDLRPSTATIEGIVTQQVAPGGTCAYPDSAHPEQRANAQYRPCGGVGISVEGDAGTWRTTSSTGDGGFQLSGIEPGEYLVRFERFGYLTQFFEVHVDAGDVLTLPPGAGGGPYDRGGRLIIDRTVQMPLTPAPDPNAGEVHGLFSDAIDPTQPFAPPSGTQIRIDGQPNAIVEYLRDGDYRTADGQFPEGAFRVRNIAPGAHTLRIESPGYDSLSTVVRISASEITDVGIIPITRLGTLTISLTSGASAPVTDADVFVTPDPEIYNDQTTIAMPEYQLGDGVRACSRTFSPDLLNIDPEDLASWFDDFSVGDEAYEFDGLCATSGGRGIAEFRRTFSTGNYLMVTPANAVDHGDPDSEHFDPELAAGMLPMDHVPLVRRLEIQSGSTVPLDIPLQRYPVITGVVRAPATDDEGLTAVREFTVEFEPFNPSTGEVIALPDDVPKVRISGGEPDGERFLEEGRYRIDRIPTDVELAGLDVTPDWRLVISSVQHGSYVRDPSQAGGQQAISGLTYNQTETINALLLPDPEQVTIRLRWQDANGSLHPVLGGYVRLEGISEYEVLEEPPYFRARQATCPGEFCVSENPPFNHTSATLFGEVVANPGGLTGLWFATSPWFSRPGNAADELTLPPFYRPSETPMRVEVHADGFGSVEDGHPDATFDLQPTGCTYDPNTWQITNPDDCEPAVHEPKLDIASLSVTGTVSLAPPATSEDDPDGFVYPDFLEGLWNISEDDDILEGLQAELFIVCHEDNVTGDVLDDCDRGERIAEHDHDAVVGPDGTFSFQDVKPGTYTLRITGDHIATHETQVTFEPTHSDVTIDAQDTTVDRLGVVRVSVTGRVPNGDGTSLGPAIPRPGATVTLERRAVSSDTWRQVAELETCEDEAPDQGGGPDCDAGRVSFVDVEIRDADGEPYEYRYRIDGLDEYAPLTGAPIDLTQQPYLDRSEQLPRFPKVYGTVHTRFGPDGFRDTIPLEDALVEVVGDERVHGSAVTDVEGRFLIPAREGIAPDTYDVEVSADDHADGGTRDWSFSYDGIFDVGTVELRADASNLSGVVSAPAGEQLWPDEDEDERRVVEVRLYLPGCTEDLDQDGFAFRTDTFEEDGVARYSFEDFGRVAVNPAVIPSGASIDELPGGTYCVQVQAFRLSDSGDEGELERAEHPDFAIVEFFVNLDPGAEVETDVELPYAVPLLSGFVTGEPWAGALEPSKDIDSEAPTFPGPGAATKLAEADVRLIDRSGSTDAEYTVAEHGYYGDDGYYAFTLVPPGTYDLQVTYEGYEQFSHGAIQLAEEPAVKSPRLVAVELDVTVVVQSSTPDLEGPLELVTVEPAYQGPLVEDEWQTPPPDKQAVETDEEGKVGWGLPPGAWRFEISGTDEPGFSPRPHVVRDLEPEDPDQENVQVGAGSVTFIHTLQPYFRVHGSVQVPGGASFVEVENVRVSVIRDDDEVHDGVIIAPDETGPDGAWAVWFAEKPEPDQGWVIHLELDGYERAEVPLDDLVWSGDGLDADVGEVRLDPSELNVEVTLTSKADDKELHGLRLVARRSGFEDVHAMVDGEATATFEGLAVGAGANGWRVSTVNAGELDVPHTDFTDVKLEIPPGRVGNDGKFQFPGSFYRWDAIVAGKVSGRNHADGDPEPLAGATVKVELTSEVDEGQMLEVASDADGDWKVALSEDASGTVTASKHGYEPESAVLEPGGFTDGEATVDLTLTAVKRDLVLTLDLPDGADVDELSGLPLIARGSSAPVEASVEVADSQATATFNLAPGTWKISVVDGEDDPGFLINHEVVLAAGGSTVSDTLTLAVLRGTIRGRDFNHPNSPERPLEGIKVTVRQGGVDVITTTDPDGDWQVGVAEGVLTDAYFEDESGAYDPTVVDIPSLMPSGVYSPSSLNPVFIANPVAVHVALGSKLQGLPGLVGDDNFHNVTISAAWNGEPAGAPSNVRDVPYDVSSEAWVLNLRPGDWVISTSNAPASDAPHEDISENIVVEPTGDTQKETFGLTHYPLLHGTVGGAYYQGGPSILPDEVTVTTDIADAVVSTLTVEPEDDEPGTYVVWLPDESPWDGGQVVFEATHFVDGTVSGELTFDDGVAVRNVTLTAEPQTVTVAVVDSDGDPVRAEVHATPVPDDGWGPEPTSVQTVLDGEVGLDLAPGGGWTVCAAVDDTSASETVTVGLGSVDPEEVTLTLSESGPGCDGDTQEEGEGIPIVGTVSEVRGDDQVIVPGVQVFAERGDGTFSTTSTTPNAAGDNLHAEIPPGTWRISAARNGERRIIHEAFEIDADEPGRLDIQLPAEGIDVAGQIVAPDGLGVEGARVAATSAVGTSTALADADGRYTLRNLDNRVAWALTFSPPEGVGGAPVTRYLALNGDLTVEVTLDQQIPSALGQIDVEVIGGTPGLPVNVQLSETTPFPTLGPEARMSSQATLDDDGRALVEFEHLVPGDGRSVQQNRFMVVVDVQGYDPFTRSGLDVAPGATTMVRIDLDAGSVVTRDVELTLIDDTGAPIVDRTVRLRNNGSTLSATAAHGDNTYTIVGVEPGAWSVVVDGFEPGTLNVPADQDEVVSLALTLIRRPDHEEQVDEDPVLPEEPEAPWDRIETPDAEGPAFIEDLPPERPKPGPPDDPPGSGNRFSPVPEGAGSSNDRVEDAPEGSWSPDRDQIQDAPEDVNPFSPVPELGASISS